ncbi:MAG: tetratricopeptide repeat protein [Nitrospirota bacterium]|nr:tetratricopeptide repeat protein [Nitrospirota bacterium]
MLSKTVVVFAIVLIVWSGCQSASPLKLLSAPTGVIATAAQHNEEGILAYRQNQWAEAKQHFEAAITAAPNLAEGHYNLGMALYKLKDFKAGDRHFIEAANLAPGNKVIWDSPALKHVTVPEKEAPGGADNHGHSH